MTMYVGAYLFLLSLVWISRYDTAQALKRIEDKLDAIEGEIESIKDKGFDD